MRHRVQKGFTLIELSIVLIIIGLLVGAILTGRDMIRSAEIRATISQIEQYNTAVHTFQLKYHSLPGDMQASDASALGFFTFDNSCGFGLGTVGCGDGDGLLVWSKGIFLSEPPFGEELAFWRHLSDTQLTSGLFGTVGNSALKPDGKTTGTVTDPSQLMPAAKLGSQNYITVWSFPYSGFLLQNINYFVIMPVTKITPGDIFGYSIPANAGITPIEGFTIDTKLDDGRPGTGTVLAVNPNFPINSPNFNSTPTDGFCISGNANNPDWNTNSSTGGNTPDCAVAMPFH